MRSIIVDAGALVALFNPGDRHRPAIAASLREQPAEIAMVTTWPCVTEASHVLPRFDQRLAMLEFMRAGRCQVIEFSQSDLETFLELMTRYRDRQMDFADASLIWLATAAGTRAILTTDRNDFETYRLPGNKCFDIL